MQEEGKVTANATNGDNKCTRMSEVVEKWSGEGTVDGWDSMSKWKKSGPESFEMIDVDKDDFENGAPIVQRTIVKIV